MDYTTKEFEFFPPDSSTDASSVKVTISEITKPEYGLYVWPCAPVLAQYIMENKDKILGKTVLEIGSGTALPGIVAAKCGANVILSDNPLFADCLKLCQRNVDLNKAANVEVEGIVWGMVMPSLCNLPKLDFILASDCFYDSKDFEDVIVTLSFLLQQNPDAEVWCSYQERSSNRNIRILLNKWNLKASQMSFPSMNCVKMSNPTYTVHVIRLFRIQLDADGG